jgi:hypothetical protein
MGIQILHPIQAAPGKVQKSEILEAKNDKRITSKFQNGYDESQSITEGNRLMLGVKILLFFLLSLDLISRC